MTNRIIYHDFQQHQNLRSHPEPATLLTARVLVKGRRWHRFWNRIPSAVDTTCLALCGAVVALSLYVLTVLL